MVMGRSLGRAEVHGDVGREVAKVGPVSKAVPNPRLHLPVCCHHAVPELLPEDLHGVEFRPGIPGVLLRFGKVVGPDLER